MILPGNSSNTLPKIIFEEIDGIVTIEGRSISASTKEYLTEFLRYFKECMETNPTNLTICIDLQYFNTTTTKMLVDFLAIVKTIRDKGFKTIVNWFVDSNDEDMLETVFDFQVVSGLEIKILEKGNTL